MPPWRCGRRLGIGEGGRCWRRRWCNPSCATGSRLAESAKRGARTPLQHAFTLRADGLGRRIAGGASYQFLGIALRTVLTIGSTATLARLLTPADFGYVAMATVVTEFAALLGAFGFGNVMVQRRVINRLQLDTVFWATVAIGALLTGVVFVLSFTTGWLFADPHVGALLRVLCLTFVINSLTTVPWIVIARQMRFHIEFWINLGTVVIRIGAAIVSAAAGLGVWSLVVGAVVGSLAAVTLYSVFVPYLPRRRMHLPFLRSIWRTSSGYLGNSTLYYLNTNLDLLLIGRRLGPTPLGYYQNARALTDEIRARIAMPIQQVLFPAFSAIQTDRARFQQLVLRAGRLLAAVVVPIGVGVSANAPELVSVLYGEAWRPMIPVMAMFGLSAALRAASAISQPLFNSNNRVVLAFRYNAVGTALLVAGVLLTMPYGIEAVGIAVAMSSLYSVVTLRAAFGLIGLGTRHVLQVLGPPAVASGVMWLAIASIRAMDWNSAPSVMLGVQVASGSIVYLLTLHILSRQYLNDLRQARGPFLSRS
ncbi:MAG: lipopolysaccharide biosynthesis protein [Burkholderiaceae bacterium]|nr:lipopolysaccharide biosynthesis protein [Burkholderiaceae bacterium]